jgi:peptidoglycan/LPS O-acetylase OafA/YrhL
MAGMSARYSRRDFLINRGFRIFPTLWIFVIIVAIMQINLGLKIEFTQFLANMFLLTGIIPKAALIGITWTLILEMYFYLLTASVGRWTSKKVLAASFLLFFIHEFVSKPGFYLVEFGFVSFDARRLLLNVSLFFLIMLIGTAMAVDKNKMSSITVLSLTLIALSDSRRVNKDWIGWDWNLTSIIVPILIFVIIQQISTQFPKFFSQKLFASLGDIVYPLYLFHIPVGIGSMLILRYIVSNGVVLLVVSLFFVILSSWIVHLIVEKPGISLGRKLVHSKGRQL